MSFQFRRRNDVREQSQHQEPFFQNPGQQQPFVDQQGFYPSIGQNDQRFNTFSANRSVQQPYPQQNNQGGFFGPQQPPQPQQPSSFGNYGFGPQGQQQMPQQIPSQAEGFVYPVQASQLNQQRSNNYMGNHFQQQSYHPQNFSNPQQPQGYFGNQGNFVPDEQFQGNMAAANPMAFWNEPQHLQQPNSNETVNDANSPVKLLVAIAGVAIVAAFSWFAYKWAKAPSYDTPPLIHAEPGSHKVSPNHRGGINIPYQDKLIYNRIGDAASDDPAERLLPPPEQPVMEPQVAPQPPYDPAQAQNNGQMAYPPNNQAQAQQYPQEAINQGDRIQNQHQNQQAMPRLPNLPAQNIQVPVHPGQVNSPQPPEITAKEQKNKSEETEEAVKAQPPAKKTKHTEVATSGNFYVQLATVNSEAEAIKEWDRLKLKYNLRGMKSQIKESERRNGETVFRLLMGPFPEKVKALKHAVKIDGSKVIHVTD